MNSGEEISGEFVVACGDGTKVLEFVEEKLDEVTFAVEQKVTISLDRAIGFWLNYRGDLPAIEGVDQRISVVSPVAKQGGWIDTIDRVLRISQIVGLSRCQHQFDRIAQSIDECVDSGFQSATGSADGPWVVFSSFVIPAHLADEIANEAFEMTAFEDFVTEQAQKGRGIFGLYPATDEQTLVDFAAWRKATER